MSEQARHSLRGILPAAVHLVSADGPPPRWAADLGKELASALDDAECDQLQDHVIGLGHGVQLAHLRTAAVLHPVCGVWKARQVLDEASGDWLWLTVLIPAGDASRHLGWMAHLAAGLHDDALRMAIRQAGDATALRAGLEAMIARQPPAVQRRTTTPLRPLHQGQAATHRLVVAILKEIEVVDHLLALYVQNDVRGATVIEARGMAEYLSAHMSLFAGFRAAFRAVGHSQLVMTLVETGRTAEVLDLITQASGGLRHPGSGIAFAIDVPAVVGIDKDE